MAVPSLPIFSYFTSNASFTYKVLLDFCIYHFFIELPDFFLLLQTSPPPPGLLCFLFLISLSRYTPLCSVACWFCPSPLTMLSVSFVVSYSAYMEIAYVMFNFPILKCKRETIQAGECNNPFKL